MEILLKASFVKDYFLRSNWSSLYRSLFLKTARKENYLKSSVGSLFEIKGFLLFFSFLFPTNLLTRSSMRNKRQTSTFWFYTIQHRKAVWFRVKAFYQWSDCTSRHKVFWRAVQKQHEWLLVTYTKISPRERYNFLSWAVWQGISDSTTVKLHLFHELQFDPRSQKLIFIWQYGLLFYFFHTVRVVQIKYLTLTQKNSRIFFILTFLELETSSFWPVDQNTTKRIYFSGTSDHVSQGTQGTHFKKDYKYICKFHKSRVSQSRKSVQGHEYHLNITSSSSCEIWLQ